MVGTEIGWSRGRQVPVETYDNLYKRFNPQKFNPQRWAKLFKDAGSKYLAVFFYGALIRFLPHLHLGFSMAEAEGIHTVWSRSVLLILAITIHNIPEGLAVGMAFGAVATPIWRP